MSFSSNSVLGTHGNLISLVVNQRIHSLRVGKVELNEWPDLASARGKQAREHSALRGRADDITEEGKNQRSHV
jgi:hypothetical protein